MNTTTNFGNYQSFDPLAHVEAINIGQHGQGAMQVGVQFEPRIFAFEGHLGGPLAARLGWIQNVKHGHLKRLSKFRRKVDADSGPALFDLGNTGLVAAYELCKLGLSKRYGFTCGNKVWSHGRDYVSDGYACQAYASTCMVHGARWSDN